jgi:hypothetical protein
LQGPGWMGYAPRSYHHEPVPLQPTTAQGGPSVQHESVQSLLAGVVARGRAEQVPHAPFADVSGGRRQHGRGDH